MAQTDRVGSPESSEIQIPARFRTTARPLITQSIDRAHFVRTLGAVHPAVAMSRDLGPVDGAMVMEHLQFVLRRPSDRQAALDAFVDELHRPGSDVYHRWLTPDEIGAEFGPSQSDVESIRSYLKSEGLTVNHIGKSGMFVDFTGTARQIQASFHTEIHNILTPDGRQRYSAVKPASLPEALAPIVVGFVSMSNVESQTGAREEVPQEAMGRAEPDFTGTCGGVPCYAVGAQDFYTIYNEKPIIDAGSNTGAGITIALLEPTGINVSDVTTFRTMLNVVPNAAPVTVTKGYTLSGSTTQFCSDPGTSTTSTNAEQEAVLDAEWAGAVAPGANLLVVACESGATEGYLLSAEAVIDDNHVPIMSLSYITAETSGSTGFASTLWEQAAAQGQTVVVCAGDTGSATNIAGQHQAIAKDGFVVNEYASTAYNVAAGGTDFQDTYNQTMGDSAYGIATYWNANDAAGKSSARSYIPETTWNDSCAGSLLAASQSLSISELCNQDGSAGKNMGGSGGASILNPRPSWQNGTVYGLPEAGGLYTGRLLPDISFFASDGSAGWKHKLLFYELDLSTSLSTSGGTSFVAPQVAGIFALIEQKTGTRLGQPDYELYSLAGESYGTVTFTGAGCNGSGADSNAGTTSSIPDSSCIFYDITTGNNSQECASGTSGCYTEGNSYGYLSVGKSPEPAFVAGQGYDLATGIGSANINNLVNAWPVPNFSLTMSAWSLNIAAGQTGQVTVTVAPGNGFNSQVTLSCSGLPAEASCNFTPASITPNGASATSEFAITTTARAASTRSPSEYSRRPSYAFLFPGLAIALGIVLRRSRRSSAFRLLFLLIPLVAVSALSGCSHHANPGTPNGTYSVVVSATSSGANPVNQSSTLTITITN